MCRTAKFRVGLTAFFQFIMEGMHMTGGETEDIKMLEQHTIQATLSFNNTS